MPDDQLDIEIDIPMPKGLSDQPLVWKDAVEDTLKDAFSGEPVTMCRRELYETAFRSQRVAQGHVSSLEAHLEAIRVAVAPSTGENRSGLMLYLDMVRRVRGILDGSINIFSGEEQQPIEIVAAVRRLVRRDGTKYWICRRTSDGRSGGLIGMWEYPGGKVEEGETHIDAMRREMREEFDVEITFMPTTRGGSGTTPLDIITRSAPWYNDKLYRLTFFSVAFLSEPKFRVHDQAKWCTVEELLERAFLPSGAEFNRRLALAKETT